MSMTPEERTRLRERAESMVRSGAYSVASAIAYEVAKFALDADDERARLEAQILKWRAACEIALERAEAAEARVKRLEEALQRIDVEAQDMLKHCPDNWNDWVSESLQAVSRMTADALAQDAPPEGHPSAEAVEAVQTICRSAWCMLVGGHAAVDVPGRSGRLGCGCKP